MAVLHRASWVVPVSLPPFANGGVLVEHGRIVEVGKWDVLQGNGAQIIDHGDGILMPGLVNGHTHLELSHCTVSGCYEKPGDMVGWIADLLRFRESYQGLDQKQARQECLQAMCDEGVDLLVDIGNEPFSSQVDCKGKVLFLRELLGLSTNAAARMIALLASEQADYTCHAPYSTNKELLLQVKKQSRVRDKLFSIHVAESQAEMEFIQTGQGAFRGFIEARKGWDNSFEVPGCSPVKYLYNLGLLDDYTLCVHCVHVDADDLQLLGKSQAQVCLCPGSNEYLGVGSAPVSEMLAAGLHPCLGTDSLASNPAVSIWREMNLLHRYDPNLTGAEIVAMATRNGGLALGCPEYGVLEKDAVSMIFVEYNGSEPLDYLSFDSALKHVTRCM
jgi:cytosine/adenosine deaminase-related metal-dependent hydrolase